ncbi:MAG: methyltransferase domain-containing protein [Chloroflexi bacterium]|nr:methyltransferase domain-containing protein [Chloroflexota bacterium]
MVQQADTNTKKRTTLPKRVDPLRVLALLPIRPYHRVADFGCGEGHFTIPLAKYLFDGRVYAVDFQPEALAELGKRLQEVHLTNVEAIQVEKPEIPLEKESLDGLLITFTLGQIEQKAVFLKHALSLLRKGGWATILEEHKAPGSKGGASHDKKVEEAEALAQEAGFRIVDRRSLDSTHTMILLRK